MSIEDIIKAYWLTAKKGKVGEIYNIGDGKNILLKDFLKKLIKLSNKKILTKVNRILLRKTDIKKQIPNSNKFKKDTGWTVNKSLSNILENFLNEIRSDTK